MSKQEELKKQILELTAQYYAEVHDPAKKEFVPGESFVHYGGRVFDEQEMKNLIDSSLDFWLTTGPWTLEFENRFAKWIGSKYCSLTNSGSSANLLAFFALTSPLGDRRIKRGDEVITVACAFPTTVTPIMQYGAIPVFVDITIPEYNIDCSQLEQALSSKTKAVMVAHSLGNPFNLQVVSEFCKKYNLWLIEDNCDALGTEIEIDGIVRKSGTVGDIGTSSFFPAHQMTMGEGGAVYTDNPLLNKIIRSFRNWGRDCWCIGGVDNTCNNRFTKQYGELPLGYDHKYVYSHLGFNLKVTDMQAAIGCAQLDKIDGFVESRRKNFKKLYDGLLGTKGIILPEAERNSNPSWFGFPFTVSEDAGFTRNELTQYLENKKIQTRTLFAGNIIKHPAFDEMRETGEGYRIVGELPVTDYVMNNTLWIGVFPGMTDSMLDYMIATIKEFCNR